MRNKRIYKSNLEIDKEEQTWWDKHANFIEQIWPQSFQIQKLVRKHYLKRAAAFFENNGNKKIEILEPGCGSGWVGRHIVNKNIRITGTDFSVEQIKLAETIAIKNNLVTKCRYEVADGTEFNKNFDGVLLHSFLHHLSTEELEIFFSNLKKVNSGTKIFMYEPVYHEAKGKPPGLISKLIMIIGDRYLKMLKKIISKIYQKDEKLKLQFDIVYKKALENGWHFSPKEIPFYEQELINFFNKDFVIMNSYCVSRIDYQLGLELMFHGIQKPNFFFRNLIFPIATIFDKLIFSKNYRYFLKNDFLFTCYEIIKK